MKPSVLLYNPPAAATAKVWLEPMPLNVMSVCSLVDSAQYDIKVAQDFPENVFAEFLPRLDNAVCLGISCMTGLQIHHGLRLAGMVKNIKPRLPIIFGGYHPTALPEQTVRNPYVDIVVRGYGEETFVELLEVFAGKRSYEDILGITFLRQDKVVNNPNRTLRNLNNLPPVPYRLFDVEKYFVRKKSRTLCYITSRGCPHCCGFCADYVIYERKWNPLSAERVIQDLENLKKTYNYDAIQFYDPNMFVDEKRIKNICEGVIKKKLNFSWIKCNGDALILSRYSDETLSLMKKAGIANMLLGVESGYENALKCIYKPANLDQIFHTVERLHQHDISIGFSCMFGFPYDLPNAELPKEHAKEILATMKMISQFSKDYIEGDYYLLFIYTPYPGVKLFPRYEQLGYVSPHNFEGWSKVNLYEPQSNPWLTPGVLKLYNISVKINWFFMRKIKRNMFRDTKNKFLNKFVLYLDRYAIEALSKRIDRGKLNIPFILLAICDYYGLKEIFQTFGIKGFFLKCVSYVKKICTRFKSKFSIIKNH